jgi:hypothetical protein
MAGMALAFVACSGGGTRADNPLLQGMHQPSDQVQEGCHIARRKCTRCHTMDQLLSTKVSSPEAWRLYVHRMRLMPGADIYPAEEPKIVQCLVYRSFGSQGLDSLEKGPE